MVPTTWQGHVTCLHSSCPISNSMVFTNAIKIQIGEISISIFLNVFSADAGGFIRVVHLNSLKSDYLACPCLNILQTRHTYERMRAAARCSTMGSIFGEISDDSFIHALQSQSYPTYVKISLYYDSSIHSTSTREASHFSLTLLHLIPFQSSKRPIIARKRIE